MNIMFTCSPSGFTLAVGAWIRDIRLANWADDLIKKHRAKCPYCLFEKDPQTGRDVGQ